MRKAHVLRMMVRGTTLALGVVILCALAPAALAVDISGHWFSNIGNEYDIVQIGDGFEWIVPATGEIGVGKITGNTADAVWPFGHASGNIITDPSGWAIEIVWSNGVLFTRGGAPGTPPGGPTPGGGGGAGDPNFSFGPNPARVGGELWIDLTEPVGGQIQVFLNNMNLPIINNKGASYVICEIPPGATGGVLEIEYQGRRIQSNQPNNFLDIAPVDVGGNWVNHATGYTYTMTQNGTKHDVKWTNPGAIFIIGTDTGSGDVYGGDQINVHWGSKPPSMNLNDVGTITDMTPEGRALRIQWNSGDVWERP